MFQTGLFRSERRVAKHYRIGPGTRAYDDPSFLHQVHAFDGNGLRPYAPVHVKSAKIGAGDEISWIRRTRLDGDGWDGFDVPLGEETESYLVKIRINGSVIREQVTSEPRWTYPSTMKAADGVTGTYEVDVAQISASYGPGSAARLLVG